MKQLNTLLTKLKILFFIAYPLFSICATTNLSPQDIVFLQINTDGGADELALLVLEDIPGNEIFFISDISWNNTGETYGNSSERGIKVTVNSDGLPAGTIIRVDNPTGALYTLQDATQGTLEFYEVDGATETGGSRELTLSPSGDQVFIFQTTDGNITSAKSFIYGMNMSTPATSNGWSDNTTAIGTSSSLSHLPSSLTALDNSQSNKISAAAFAIAKYKNLGSTFDNFQYTGPTTATNKNGWLTRIHTLSNWSATESSLYDNNIIAANANSVIVSSSPISWVGATSNDWNTGANWSTGQVPANSADIILPSGLTNYPTASIPVTFNTLTINSGASFLPQSTATGTITIKRNLPTTNWYLVGAPLSGETAEDIIASHTFATGSGSNIGVATYNNNGASRWNYYTSAQTGAISSGVGFSVKLALAGDLIITGSANTSNVFFPIAVGSQDNFNLLSNPFLAYVNSATFATLNTGLLSEKTLWLWDGTQYQTYNEASPIELAPGQAFFVEASSSGNVTFETSNRSHQSTDTFMRQTPSASFELLVDNGDVKKSTKVFYIANKTKGFDNGYDSKLFSGVENDFKVYTNLLEGSQGNKLAIQTLPDSGFEDMVIPVGLESKSGEKITFSIASFNLPTGLNVYLEDREKSTFINLTEEKHSLTFSEDIKGLGRFYIHTSAKVLHTKTLTALSGVDMYKAESDILIIHGLDVEAEVRFFNLIGKEVFKTKVDAKLNNSIQLPRIVEGIYVVKLSTVKDELHKKIIID